MSLIERSLHRWRRRVAREQITHIGLPGNVLFVCHGNVCRSPYAALAFKKLLAPTIGRSIRIDSAGLAGPGLLSPATAIAAAAARGVDLSTHRSKPLTPDRAAGMDVVVVMDGDQAATVARRFSVPKKRILVLGDVDPGPIQQRAIRDPVDQPRDVFDAVYARIDRCLVAWLGVLFENDR